MLPINKAIVASEESFQKLITNKSYWPCWVSEIQQTVFMEHDRKRNKITAGALQQLRKIINVFNSRGKKGD